MKRYTTTYLLTVAALAAAAAVLLAAGNWFSYATIAIPLLNAAVIGVWALPFAAALRLLRLPGTVLLVGLLSGLIMGPFQPDGFRAVYVNLWFAFFFELLFAVTLYRVRGRWLFIVSGAVNGLIWGVTYALAVGAASFPFVMQVALIATAAASSALFALAGVSVADALVARGVGTITRRTAERGPVRAAAVPGTIVRSRTSAEPSTASTTTSPHLQEPQGTTPSQGD